jgi:hypothetical protein
MLNLKRAGLRTGPFSFLVPQYDFPRSYFSQSRDHALDCVHSSGFCVWKSEKISG